MIYVQFKPYIPRKGRKLAQILFVMIGVLTLILLIFFVQKCCLLITSAVNIQMYPDQFYHGSKHYEP